MGTVRKKSGGSGRQTERKDAILSPQVTERLARSIPRRISSSAMLKCSRLMSPPQYNPGVARGLGDVRNGYRLTAAPRRHLGRVDVPGVEKRD